MKGNQQIGSSERPQSFHLLKMILRPMDVRLSEKRYLVFVPERKKRLMIGEKLGDAIVELQRGRSIEEAAHALSESWKAAVTPEQLRAIIAEHLVPRGLAFPEGERPCATAVASPRPRAPFYVRLLRGLFRWPLINQRRVNKICAPMTVAYEPFSVVAAVVLIVSTRVMLYRGMTATYYLQWISKLTPVEYLAGIGLVIAVVLIHEFGHAAAQVLFGLKPGPIGLQLYFYIPALFADVSGSWGLKPRQRIVVDVGGVYFQCIAASLLYLLYTGTHFAPLKTAAVASDALCLISLNPFLKFDGYWMLGDVLAVPNLRDLSRKVLVEYVSRLLGRRVGRRPVPVSIARKVILALYALLKNCFWLALVSFIVRGSIPLWANAWGNVSNFLQQALRGFQTLDPALLLASVLRLSLLILLLLTTCCLFGNLLVAAGKLAVAFAQRCRSLRGSATEIEAGSRQGASEVL
jgi:putative peptide zinc metalloprotease protein